MTKVKRTDFPFSPHSLNVLVGRDLCILKHFVCSPGTFDLLLGKPCKFWANPETFDLFQYLQWNKLNCFFQIRSRSLWFLCYTNCIYILWLGGVIKPKHRYLFSYPFIDLFSIKKFFLVFFSTLCLTFV